MSAALLMDTLRRVTIEDELESFFHILVYYAVRYLKSNLSTDEEAAQFLEKCYDCFVVCRETIMCGTQKSTIVGGDKIPAIVFNHPLYRESRPIKFANKKLNTVVTEFIICLRARYKDLKHKAWLERHPNHPGHPERRERFQTPPPAKRRRLADGRSAKLTRRGDEDEQDDDDSGEKMPPAATKEDLLQAQKLATHLFIKATLRMAVDSDDWKEDDRVPDRVPSDYKFKTPLLEAIPVPKAKPATTSK